MIVSTAQSLLQYGLTSITLRSLSKTLSRKEGILLEWAELKMARWKKRVEKADFTPSHHRRLLKEKGQLETQAKWALHGDFLTVAVFSCIVLNCSARDIFEIGPHVHVSILDMFLDGGVIADSFKPEFRARVRSRL